MNMDHCKERFLIISSRAHYSFCHDDVYNAIRAKNRINRLTKTLMNLEKSEDSIKLMSKLFTLEYELSMLIIQCLKTGADSSPESD